MGGAAHVLPSESKASHVTDIMAASHSNNRDPSTLLPDLRPSSSSNRHYYQRPPPPSAVLPVAYALPHALVPDSIDMLIGICSTVYSVLVSARKPLPGIMLWPSSGELRRAPRVGYLTEQLGKIPAG